ncbi:MAG: penicillin-binding protein 1A [Rhodospirillaceae bacterium]|nr:penicillin-binding protein 1A [Rhodospirillaceae bacterium]
MLRLLAILTSVLLFGVFIAGAGIIWAFYEFGRGLPDHRQLATYEPPVTTRVYAGDGQLLHEYAVEGRVFVPIEDIPRRVIDAFLSAEDKTFYSHHGIDFAGIVSAVVTNIGRQMDGRRMVGASTITQQVAKNFLLGNEYSFDRKIREQILAVRLEQTFSKDHILELYLNEIYLGGGSYGVASAARSYFDKSLDELTVSEAAYLAGLAKAPNNYHPDRNPAGARERRDYVVGRLVEDGRIDAAAAAAARTEPLIARKRRTSVNIAGGEFFAEEVRRDLARRYGDDALYKGGLAVRTSLEPDMQAMATRALQHGLMAYDLRHGWRGPVASGSPGADPRVQLDAVKVPAGLPAAWRLAAVGDVDAAKADLNFADGTTGTLPLAGVTWARPWKPDQTVGERVTQVGQVVRPGDIVFVEPLVEAGQPDAGQSIGYALRQIPQADGAVVAVDPHTGRVFALDGGFVYARSEFNRATQALRQPGSAFKPFVYLTAMEAGYTPSTLILDAPFVMDQGPGLPKWKPKNYTSEYLGLASLRKGIEKSQNLMTVRLAQAVGIDRVGATAQRFGIVDQWPGTLAASLGSEVTTVLRLTAAYGMLVNGGKKVTPTLIDRIQDRDGRTVERRDRRPCLACTGEDADADVLPVLPDTREQIADPASAYQVVHLLEGVVERGTGRAVAAVGKPLAGKTGTSNDAFDTWFVGFSPDLAVGVFVGFDEPRTLGPRETGGAVAAPIFRDFMIEALAGKPATPFRVPPGVTLVRVDPDTGKPAMPGQRNAILEAFKPGTSPFGQSTIMGAAENNAEAALTDQPSVGGLY